MFKHIVLLYNKMNNSEKLKKAVLISLFIHIIIQPFLDTYYLFSDGVINVFGVSPSTIIRFAGIIILCFMTLCAYGFTKKFFLLLGYLFLVLVYFIFHCINATNFYSPVPKLQDFSLISEAVYTFRLIYPALIVYISASVKFTKEFFVKTITTISLTISGLIVSTNLFCISLDSYTNKTIKSNIFSWFTDGYTNDAFNGLASKAFFNYANAVSVILCMLLPLVIYAALSKKNILMYLVVVLQCIAMLMLGTKTSTYGVCLVLICCVLIYIFFLIINGNWKDNIRKIAFNSLSLLCILAIVAFIYPKSPAVYRNNISSNYIENYDETKSENNSPEESDTNEDLLEKDEGYIEVLSMLHASGISSKFYYNSYPFQYDTEFWTEISSLDSSYRLKNRFIEEAMLKRVKEINDNPLDHLFGITYERTSSIYNLERDFLYQYYSMGIIGVVLLLCPYILLLIYGIVYCLKNFKSRCNIRNVLMLFSIALVLGTSFYCGNSIDGIFVNSLLGFVCGAVIVLLNTHDNTMETNREIK